MKKTLFQTTVGTLVISLSLQALANRVGKSATERENSQKPQDVQAVKSNKTLKPAAAIQELSETRKKLVEPLLKALPDKEQEISNIANLLDYNMVADLTKGLKAQGVRSEVAQMVIKIAQGLKNSESDDLGRAVLSALSQAAGQRGKIFGEGSEDQIVRAKNLATKILNSNDIDKAITDYLTEKNGRTASAAEVEEFKQTLKECV